MLGLTHSYAGLLAKEGITVNAIAPALIETEMVTSNPRANPNLIPVGRFGLVDEVASVAVMTLSRFPVQLCQNYDVTWRKRERRGCLRTDLQISDSAALHIFNVHLGTGFIERRHQVRRLLSADVLNQTAFRGPRIVVGDFNEWTRGLASRFMKDASS